MVSTVRPKASETPKRPMPTWGKAAAMTALPQPPKVSQNVPIASATYFFVSILFPPAHPGKPVFPRSCGLQLTLCADSSIKIRDIAVVGWAGHGGRDG